MCGFAGFLGGTNNFSIEYAQDLLKKMGLAIKHRGPDDAGEWYDSNSQIGFGYRRLSIVDLSSAGHQPMHSASGRYTIVYNGEIYNHLSLRKELACKKKAPDWRGHSDTETLLACIEAWGIRQTVERTIGMFAFAVWDKKNRLLTLGRDRIGEKPLYYGWQGEGSCRTFLFGSELKSLRISPSFSGSINREALNLLLRFNYIPAPYSIYNGISKLLPGSLLTVSLETREPEIYSYWSALEKFKFGANNNYSGNEQEFVNELESLLKDSIGQQMVADVPLGAFLSGGIDSSTIASIMQSLSKKPIKTFTIGFNEKGYNEAENAKKVAAYLGTEHTELYVTPKEALDVIPRIHDLYDEPFSDSSQIPTFLVAQLARKFVTVSLSGDAGDELFCGYKRYKRSENLWRAFSVIPKPLRDNLASCITKISPKDWNRLLSYLGKVFPSNYQYKNIGDKLHKSASILGSSSFESLYLRMSSHFNNPSSVILNTKEPTTIYNDNSTLLNGLNNMERMMAIDTVTYLPDDILVKVDRAAMGISLETRIPLLDHRIVEFAWRLPQAFKIRDGQTKWILRQVLYRYLPKELVERPKKGFAVPLDIWLKGPLLDWVESQINETRLRNEGFFDPSIIRKKWKEHREGTRNWQRQLWDILVFQSWLENKNE